MRTLTVFNSVSIDGFFTDARGDMSWAHAGNDPEWNAFVEGNAGGGGELLFGRKTYQMMESFWPTPMAAETMPVVAERMNAMPKAVFSRTLEEVSWSNTRLLTGDIVEQVRRLKEEPGGGITILGSGSLVSQLAGHGVIDEYQLVVVPIVLGSGRTLFEGVEPRLKMRRTSTRAFGNGNVLLCYAPA